MVDHRGREREREREGRVEVPLAPPGCYYDKGDDEEWGRIHRGHWAGTRGYMAAKLGTVMYAMDQSQLPVANFRRLLVAPLCSARTSIDCRCGGPAARFEFASTRRSVQRFIAYPE